MSITRTDRMQLVRFGMQNLYSNHRIPISLMVLTLQGSMFALNASFVSINPLGNPAISSVESVATINTWHVVYLDTGIPWGDVCRVCKCNITGHPIFCVQKLS
jgi:hypothetical protein